MTVAGILSARVLLQLFFLTAPIFASQSWSRSEISHYFKVIFEDELHAMNPYELQVSKKIMNRKRKCR